MRGFSHSYRTTVTVGSGSGEARRMVARICKEMELDGPTIADVETVTTELANNAIRHARGGTILAQRTLTYEGQEVLQIFAIDKGDGVDDFKACFKNGYSTTGDAGKGLGIIRKLADSIDFYSRFEQGTVVMAEFVGKIHPKQAPPPTTTTFFDIGGLNVALEGEAISGDDWIWKSDAVGFSMMLVDGLGHGHDAHKAAQVAVDYFAGTDERMPNAILESLHTRLQPTRGAAVSVAWIRPKDRYVLFAGVGNVMGVVLEQAMVRKLVTYNGTLGQGFRRVQEFLQPWSKDSILILHSDGIESHWSLDPYPGLSDHSSSLIAAIIYRDFVRKRDDASVAVVRQREEARIPVPREVRESEPEPPAKPEPLAKPEPKLESKVKPEPKAKAEASPKTKAEAKPAPKSAVKKPVPSSVKSSKKPEAAKKGANSKKSAPAKKAAKPTAVKAAAKQSTLKRAAKPAKKQAAKTSPSRNGTAKKSAASKASSGKTTAKNASAKKSPAKSAAKPPAKKSALKQVPKKVATKKPTPAKASMAKARPSKATAKKPLAKPRKPVPKTKKR